MKVCIVPYSIFALFVFCPRLFVSCFSRQAIQLNMFLAFQIPVILVQGSELQQLITPNIEYLEDQNLNYLLIRARIDVLFTHILL